MKAWVIDWVRGSRDELITAARGKGLDLNQPKGFQVDLRPTRDLPDTPSQPQRFLEQLSLPFFEAQAEWANGQRLLVLPGENVDTLRWAWSVPRNEAAHG